MVSTTINKAIKEVRELFNELRSNHFVKKQRELETNFIRKMLFIVFLKKKMV